MWAAGVLAIGALIAFALVAHGRHRRVHRAWLEPAPHAVISVGAEFVTVACVAALALRAYRSSSPSSG